MSEDQKTPVIEHLGELRRRLIRCLIAVVITSLISFIFYEQIFNILKAPIPPNFDLQAIEMTEMIGTIMRVCLFSGIILAMPYLVYQALMFVFPALTAKEKRYVYLILPWITLMFAGGVIFSYFILLPRITGFLMTFGGDIASIEPRIGSYINVITRLLLATGLVFELPVVTTFLARIGLVSPKWLASKRKLALVFAFILAAIITPTIDPINQSLVAAPLIILYEMSIWLAKLVYRGEKKAEALATAVKDE
jgi:sec-independent protein translocase protein TatC